MYLNCKNTAADGDGLTVDYGGTANGIHGNAKGKGTAGFFENYAGSDNPTLHVLSTGQPGNGVFV